MIPPKSYRELAGVHGTNRQGNGCNCDSAQRNQKKRKTLGVNADDLKKKMVLNQKVKLQRF